MRLDRTGRRLTRAAFVAAAAALALALIAPAVSGDQTAPLYAKMKQRFTIAKPGARTGWTFDGALKPWPEGEQVPPQRRVVFVFPPRTRFDPRGTATCRASDEQIASEGVSACPRRSRVGSGSGTIFLGLAGEIDVLAHVFVARPKLAAVFTTESGAVLRVLRATIDRNRVFARIAPAPLPGGYEAAITSLSLRVAAAGTRKHPLIRTPDFCPRSGRWTFVYLPRYDEPYGVQRSTSTMRCG